MQTDEFNNAVAAQADLWVPACGGTEQPCLTRSGARLLYCFNPGQRRHAYLNLSTDIIVSDEEANMLIWGANG